MAGGNWTKLVYVAGPFRGPTNYDIQRNCDNAEDLALCVWKTGGIAICPHLNTRHFQGQLKDQIWLEADLLIVKRCDALITVPGWKQSAGTRHEMELAKEWHIPVFHRLEDLNTWLESSFGKVPTSEPYEEDVDDSVEEVVCATV
jgi:hypothetical protein